MGYMGIFSLLYYITMKGMILIVIVSRAELDALLAMNPTLTVVVANRGKNSRNKRYYVPEERWVLSYLTGARL